MNNIDKDKNNDDNIKIANDNLMEEKHIFEKNGISEEHEIQSNIQHNGLIIVLNY
jgi:hypothetical protein